MKQFIATVILLVLVGGIVYLGYHMKSNALEKNPLPENCVAIQIEGQTYYSNEYEIQPSGIILVRSYYVSDLIDISNGYELVEKEISSTSWAIKEVAN